MRGVGFSFPLQLQLSWLKRTVLEFIYLLNDRTIGLKSQPATRAGFRKETRLFLPVVTVRDTIDREEHGSDLTGVAVELAVEALSREHDHYPLIMDRGVKISLDAPKLVANTAITLQLTDVPLSEAIQRTADLASCYVFSSGTGRSDILISCVNLITR